LGDGDRKTFQLMLCIHCLIFLLIPNPQIPNLLPMNSACHCWHLAYLGGLASIPSLWFVRDLAAYDSWSTACKSVLVIFYHYSAGKFKAWLIPLYPAWVDCYDEISRFHPVSAFLLCGKVWDSFYKLVSQKKAKVIQTGANWKLEGTKKITIRQLLLSPIPPNDFISRYGLNISKLSYSYSWFQANTMARISRLQKHVFNAIWFKI